MEIIQIVLIVVLIIMIIYFILWLFATTTQLTKMSDGNVEQIILAKTLANNNHSNNYTYSTWFYVNDWNYRFGEPKIILGRLDKDNNPSPSITLGAMENNINVAVACYPSGPAQQGTSTSTSNSNSNSTSTSNSTPTIHQCNVSNIPLQKWVNLIISLYGRTLDVYLDGKLVRTCVLPGVAKVNPNTNILVTPNGGFNGWTTNFQYWSTSSNPQQAYNIYKGGFGGSPLGNLFNKFRIKVSFLSDNKEKSSFVI
jgi:hypothetical protein